MQITNRMLWHANNLIKSTETTTTATTTRQQQQQHSSNLIKFPRSPRPFVRTLEAWSLPRPHANWTTCNLLEFFQHPPSLSLSLPLPFFLLFFCFAFSHLNASSKRSVVLLHRKLKVEAKTKSSNNSWPAAFFSWTGGVLGGGRGRQSHTPTGWNSSLPVEVPSRLRYAYGHRSLPLYCTLISLFK